MADTDEQKKPDAPAQPPAAEEDEQPMEAVSLDKNGDKVVMDNEEQDEEHEMVHSDELSADVNVNKVSGSQRRLWAIVIFGVAMLGFGGFMFYKQLESNPNSNSDGEAIQSTDPDRQYAEVPRGTYVYSIEPGLNALRQHNVESSEDINITTGASLSSTSSARRSFQMSSNSLVQAIQKDATNITVYSGESETNISIAGMSEWVMTADGRTIFALVGVNLHSYDTISGEGGEIMKNFAPSGADVSRLYVSRDGKVRQYAKTGIELTESVYTPLEGTSDQQTVSVIRLDRMGAFDDNSLSPDGTSLVFRANLNGNETLQLLSLNSFVLRTIYVAEVPGGFPSSFGWSEDSNNLVINVSGNGTVRLVNLKVGTLEKVVVLEQNGSGSRFLQPMWSPTKNYISYIQDGKLHVVNVEVGEVTDVFDSVSDNAVIGWYQN